MASAVHAARAPRAADEQTVTSMRTPWLRALAAVSCWCRTFGVFGNELGDGVYFVGREVDRPGTPAKA
jgi:hypothetical protein